MPFTPQPQTQSLITHDITFLNLDQQTTILNMRWPSTATAHRTAAKDKQQPHNIYTEANFSISKQHLPSQPYSVEVCAVLNTCSERESNSWLLEVKGSIPRQWIQYIIGTYVVCTIIARWRTTTTSNGQRAAPAPWWCCVTKQINWGAWAALPTQPDDFWTFLPSRGGVIGWGIM